MYLDGAATTKPSELSLKLFNEVSKNYWYNPSSMSEKAHEAYMLLANARIIIANKINCDPDQIIFTSGATEGANMIMRGFHVDNIVVSRIEHPCVYNTAMELLANGDVNVTVVDVDHYGLVDRRMLEDTLTLYEQRNERTLVCIMDTNNEIGTIQPTRLISHIVHDHEGCFLFSDMTQSFAHSQNVDVEDLCVDFACGSAHKFGGFKGVGFIYTKYPLSPLLTGGHQEDGYRAGTENVAAIWAMAKQFEEVRDDMLINYIATNMKSLYLQTLLKLNIDGVIINGTGLGVPDIVSVTLPDGDANTIISLLDDGYDIQVSAGSACSSGDNKPSRILKAIGLSDEEARRTLRITVDPEYSDEKYEDFVKILKQLMNTTKGG